MTQFTDTYKKEVESLLSNYVDGMNFMKNADDWTHPIEIKKGARRKDLPTTWMQLVEKVIVTIAEQKYGLDLYPNSLELIDAEQMLDAYASNGMPISYPHWSFAKRRKQYEDAYKTGQMGLAYEIVINTNPVLVYLMAQNSKTMQALVIAHAGVGHNTFFKNNYLFRQCTDAQEVLNDLERLKKTVLQCEERYGRKEVELLLDACHALQTHAVNRYSRPPKRTPQQEAERRASFEEHRQRSIDHVMDRTMPRKTKDDFKAAGNGNSGRLTEPEENILLYIATTAPNMPEWQRDIMRQISNHAQYFYPQRQTQLMNEGCATFWHYQLLTDLHEMRILPDGMFEEFLVSHTNVIHQPPGARINPYALGFAMFKDIKRMCENPTKEDIKWRPELAGQNWVEAIKESIINYNDSSFVQQFLSPKIMRDFHMFSVHDDDKKDKIRIAAIHDDFGYDMVRQDLASQYSLGDNEPRIEVVAYDYRDTRSLTLEHTIFNRKPLAEKEMQKVLGHISRYWGYPVLLNNVDSEGKIVGQILRSPAPGAGRFGNMMP